MVAPPRARAAGSQRVNEAVTVSPASLEHRVRPGDDQTYTMHVVNNTSRAWPITVQLMDLASAGGTEGETKLQRSGAARRGAARWIDVDAPRFLLRPGEARDLDVRIRVPRDVPAGGWYAAVVLQLAPTASGSILLTTQLVSTVLLDVAGGDERRRVTATLEPLRRWSWKQPLRWTLAVRNRGNVHERVSWKFATDGLTSGDRHEDMRSMLLLPGTERRVSVARRVRDAPDVISAHGTLRIGGQRTISVRADRVWFIPRWFLMAVMGALLVLGMNWWIRVRRGAHNSLEDGTNGPSSADSDADYPDQG